MPWALQRVAGVIVVEYVGHAGADRTAEHLDVWVDAEWVDRAVSRPMGLRIITKSRSCFPHNGPAMTLLSIG
jgi:hypothetical protein